MAQRDDVRVDLEDGDVGLGQVAIAELGDEAAAQPDHADAQRRRMEQQEAHHRAGVDEGERVGVRQGHAALHFRDGEMERLHLAGLVDERLDVVFFGVEVHGEGTGETRRQEVHQRAHPIGHEAAAGQQRVQRIRLGLPFGQQPHQLAAFEITPLFDLRLEDDAGPASAHSRASEASSTLRSPSTLTSVHWPSRQKRHARWRRPPRSKVMQLWPRQVLRRARRAVAAQVVGRSAADRARERQRARDQARVGQRAVADRHVDLVAQHVQHAVGHRQLQLQAGCAAMNSSNSGSSTLRVRSDGAATRTVPTSVAAVGVAPATRPRPAARTRAGRSPAGSGPAASGAWRAWSARTAACPAASRGA